MLNPKLKKILNVSFGMLLFAWVAYIIYTQINSKANLTIIFDNVVLHNWSITRVILLLCVLVLMLVNWSIEALKWQLLIKHLQIISFKRSLRSVFTGISVSLLTPNRIGEYGGRIIYLNDAVKLKAITANIVGSFAQFIAAALFGIVGCVFYLTHSSVSFMPWLLAFSILGLLLLCLLYFKLAVFAKWLVGFSFLKKIETTIVVVKQYDTITLIKLIAISGLRYLVFAFQYYLLLQLFFVNISFANAMPTVFLIFWCMAILPSITIAEAPIRSEMSIYFLKVFSTNLVGIMSASVGLWLINLIFPALLGALFTWGIKLFKVRE
jgi:uncharacterized membrane protein YbhN (UPF0104 family)